MYHFEEDGDIKILEEEDHLNEISDQVDRLYVQYHELENNVYKLGAAVEAHPETNYENNSEKLFYNPKGKTGTDIEIDIAILIGTTSQTWQETEELLGEAQYNLETYLQELNEHDNPLKMYNSVNDACKKIRKNLRETEREIERISVETHNLLNVQPSPNSKTILRPNSSQPIASD